MSFLDAAHVGVVRFECRGHHGKCGRLPLCQISFLSGVINELQGASCEVVNCEDKVRGMILEKLY